jgi:hypothetical protein
MSERNDPEPHPVDSPGHARSTPISRRAVADSTAELVAHTQRVMRNQLQIAPEVNRWERLVEWLARHRLCPSMERWWCWDHAQGRWRPYWRRNGSLPEWAND